MSLHHQVPNTINIKHEISPNFQFSNKKCHPALIDSYGSIDWTSPQKNNLKHHHPPPIPSCPQRWHNIPLTSSTLSQREHSQWNFQGLGPAWVDRPPSILLTHFLEAGFCWMKILRLYKFYTPKKEQELKCSDSNFPNHIAFDNDFQRCIWFT